MNATDIKARIEKTEDAIAKKKALIEKRLIAIGKTHKQIGEFCGANPYDGTLDSAKDFERTVEKVWTAHRDEVQESYGSSNNYYKILTKGEWENVESAYYNISGYIESIENAQRDIKDKEVTLATYRERLAKAEEKENALNNLPACMIEFMNSTIELWDAWDKWKRESVKNAHEEYYELCEEERKARREHGKDSEEAKALAKEARELIESYSNFEWNTLYYLKDDEIHERNVKAGKSLVLDLYNRVAEIVGKFENAENLKVTRGNKDLAVINGTVEGNGRIAKVQSIGAGGYNIQRFHIRTLVHEVH